ncbi:MAG: hypothetical protein HYU36_12280 [Planctomycetes bacterium]|nr:hypothetical protein [Planctomycetota bacterium]
MSDAQRHVLDDFRDWITATARLVVPAVGSARQVEAVGQQGEAFGCRLYTDARTWLEVSVFPSRNQVRLGLAMESRARNEQAEQLIEDSRETLDEFLELGLADAGHEDDVYRMEHFHEAGIFYFATHLALSGIEDLKGPEIRERVTHLLEGYAMAFGDIIEG